MIEPDAGFERADLQEFLDGRGIDTRTIWTGNVTRQPMLAGSRSVCPPTGCPNADAVMERGVLLPLSHAIDDETLDFVIDARWRSSSHEPIVTARGFSGDRRPPAPDWEAASWNDEFLVAPWEHDARVGRDSSRRRSPAISWNRWPDDVDSPGSAHGATAAPTEWCRIEPEERGVADQPPPTARLALGRACRLDGPHRYRPAW